MNGWRKNVLTSQHVAMTGLSPLFLNTLMLTGFMCFSETASNCELRSARCDFIETRQVRKNNNIHRGCSEHEEEWPWKKREEKYRNNSSRRKQRIIGWGGRRLFLGCVVSMIREMHGMQMSGKILKGTLCVQHDIYLNIPHAHYARWCTTEQEIFRPIITTAPAHALYTFWSCLITHLGYNLTSIHIRNLQEIFAFQTIQKNKVEKENRKNQDTENISGRFHCVSGSRENCRQHHSIYGPQEHWKMKSSTAIKSKKWIDSWFYLD